MGFWRAYFCISKDPRAKIVAIQSRRSESAQAQIQANGLTDCKIYTDYAQALADPRVDIVVICTPNDLHCEQAILAAQAGKHLLIEKPAALCWEDAQRMAKETNLPVCVRWLAMCCTSTVCS